VRKPKTDMIKLKHLEENVILPWSAIGGGYSECPAYHRKYPKSCPHLQGLPHHLKGTEEPNQAAGGAEASYRVAEGTEE
jgi:hypothetical protein